MFSLNLRFCRICNCFLPIISGQQVVDIGIIDDQLRGRDEEHFGRHCKEFRRVFRRVRVERQRPLPMQMMDKVRLAIACAR